MTIKTVSAVVPAKVKTEASAVLVAHGISMAAFLREFLACVAAGDKGTLAWLDEAHR
jgi:antitoxin component of RelBE/YafQ-DinJ toxin-antitoxin module